MANRRRWSHWPRRAAEELNGVSGVAGVGGAILGFASWSWLPGAYAIGLTGLGVVVTLWTFGYAIFRAIPPVMKRPEDLVGQTIPISELANISPRVTTLSIIGPSMAGKTTLKDRLTFSVSNASRTQITSAYIIGLQTAPQTYFAILDGGGERYAQQFKLAEPCECLCIIIDHNKSDHDLTIEPERLREHKEFLKQVRDFLDENGVAPKRWIHFLVNKRDLWREATATDQERLTNFYSEEIALWKQGHRAEHIDVATHSNDDPSDVARFVNILKETATH